MQILGDFPQLEELGLGEAGETKERKPLSVSTTNVCPSEERQFQLSEFTARP